ncbi:hypothetical protein AB0D47_39780, partial [Streptomyces sp. NPDC048376]|jgi:hypothetical protein|uniref:hypothetical protein n=1 Tax=Streptomyces sp. NPDC048376 TaxID=3154926 RepID=UPI0034394FEE
MMGFLLFAEVAQLKQFLPDPVRRIETCDLLRFSWRGRWGDSQTCDGEAAVDQVGPELDLA